MTTHNQFLRSPALFVVTDRAEVKAECEQSYCGKSACASNLAVSPGEVLTWGFLEQNSILLSRDMGKIPPPDSV